MDTIGNIEYLEVHWHPGCKLVRHSSLGTPMAMAKVPKIGVNYKNVPKAIAGDFSDGENWAWCHSAPWVV